ncbi:MAG: hypothetical protein B7Z37_28080 [Verrucomicrobia bacterium 12-59-8]|nr:MAG: hypothetical protein B7Z37_28080 [Verrucomicrobia bacterium 12-59-8]
MSSSSSEFPPPSSSSEVPSSSEHSSSSAPSSSFSDSHSSSSVSDSSSGSSSSNSESSSLSSSSAGPGDSSSSSESGNSFQPQQKSTQAPVVPVDQNGTGLPYSESKDLDSLGRTVMHVDQMGVATKFAYDNATGAMVQKIADADTSSEGGAASLLTAGSSSSSSSSSPPSEASNLVTDFETDDNGRVLREYGPVHEVQLRVDEQTVEAAMVRTMKYNVYRDDLHQVWTASGYARGNGPNYTFVTVGSVHLSFMNDSGQVTDDIEAVRVCDMGPLSEAETFPRPRWRRWTHKIYDMWGHLLSQRVYSRIPESGEGEKDYDYAETCYGYDSMGRLTSVGYPDGTSVQYVYEDTDYPFLETAEA